MTNNPKPSSKLIYFIIKINVFLIKLNIKKIECGKRNLYSLSINDDSSNRYPHIKTKGYLINKPCISFLLLFLSFVCNKHVSSRNGYIMSQQETKR